MLRGSQVEFIDPSSRRVVGEAAALLQRGDQPLYTEFDPIPPGAGCKVPVVRTEGFVPAAVSWSTAPHLHLLYFSWILVDGFALAAPVVDGSIPLRTCRELIPINKAAHFQD